MKQQKHLGSITLFFSYAQADQAVNALCRLGETTLTIDALQKHALPPDLRARMERESHAGACKMDQAKAQSKQELQQVLGNPAPVPGTAPTTTHHLHGAGASKPSSDANLRTHGQTRVERAVARDSVGDQVQTLNSPKCTFSGVVPIELQHFLGSGVTLVECPNYARMRSLSPSKGVLRFKSHNKRQTNANVSSKRWAMRETIRNVVGGERT